jgi:ubiquinone/menaquinone biosynthesis C-methylase UbiE
MAREGTTSERRTPHRDTYEQRLYVSDFLRRPVIRSAIQALQLPAGSRGLDAGCGIGSHTSLLARAVGPTGHVTGVDLSAGFLARAREQAEKSGVSEWVSFRQGNVNKLPFDDDTFDWIWSVDCVGYPAGDAPPVLKELARVAKRGGTVAILCWSSQQLLPGYPLLEARLNAPAAAIAPYLSGRRPEAHFMRALGWFKAAGLEEPRARTFVGDVQAPLTGEVRRALESLFRMLWDDPKPDVTDEDWAEYRRLSQPESPEFVLDLPDYYGFFTYSMFQGRVRK